MSAIISFVTGGIGRWLVLAVGIAIALAVVRHHYIEIGRQEVQVKFDAFVAKTKAEGEKAQAESDAHKAADIANKEKADHENAATVAALNTVIYGLRHSNTSAGNLPPAPAGSSRPDLACFDRAAYQSAYGILVEGLRGLADEGTAATVDLNTAKRWSAQPAER